ncbi:MAG: putative membrane protein affecting hemolysin expression, partial [Alteromonadaceae bacterium]
MNQAQLTPSSVYRRLSQVGLSICLLISVLNMWVNTSVNGSKVHIDTLSQLTRQMAQQSALSAANFIKQKQPQQLTLLLNNLTSNEYIEQSMIYDNNGNVLARSEEALTAHQA